MRALPIAFVTICACGTTYGSTSPSIEVRTGGPVVTGTNFTCTGAWPSDETPCQTPWQSSAAVSARAESPGTLQLSMRRDPIPVDGGASVVTITLDVGSDGTVTDAEAVERTTAPGLLTTKETSEPTSGWVLPVAVSADATARNAGQFHLEFVWGTIDGTYDTSR